jgi:hypothetical protein
VAAICDTENNLVGGIRGVVATITLDIVSRHAETRRRRGTSTAIVLVNLINIVERLAQCVNDGQTGSQVGRVVKLHNGHTCQCRTVQEALCNLFQGVSQLSLLCVIETARGVGHDHQIQTLGTATTAWFTDGLTAWWWSGLPWHKRGTQQTTEGVSQLEFARKAITHSQKDLESDNLIVLETQ